MLIDVLIDMSFILIQSERPVRQHTDFPEKQPIGQAVFSTILLGTRKIEELGASFGTL